MIKEKKIFHEIKFNHEIYYINKIKDDKLSIALQNGDIYIYNINNFSLILEIKKIVEFIFNVFIMKDNSILICSFYNMIIIEIESNNKYKIKDKIKFDNNLNSNIDFFAIEINNNCILLSKEKELILWKKNIKNYKFEIYKKTKIDKIIELLELNEKYFVGIYYFENQNKIFSIFDIENLQIIISLHGKNIDSGILRKINNKIFLFVNNSYINFFNYEKMEIIKQISLVNLYPEYLISTILKLKNGNLLLSLGIYNTSINEIENELILVEYDYINNNFIEYKIQEDNIYCLIEYNNYLIIGGASKKLLILK